MICLSFLLYLYYVNVNLCYTIIPDICFAEISSVGIFQKDTSWVSYGHSPLEGPIWFNVFLLLHRLAILQHGAHGFSTERCVLSWLDLVICDPLVDMWSCRGNWAVFCMLMSHCPYSRALTLWCASDVFEALHMALWASPGRCFSEDTPVYNRHSDISITCVSPWGMCVFSVHLQALC